MHNEFNSIQLWLSFPTAEIDVCCGILCSRSISINTIIIMEGEDHTAQQLRAAFGTCDLYEIFQVEKNASTELIRSAYKKLALKHHPDKGGNAEVFKGLSVAHSILSNEEKRKTYDLNGSLDDEDTKSFSEWYEYFRNLFPKLTISAIENFEKSYCGSAEERTDVLREYIKHKGKLSKIMESVMLAEEGKDEARICDIIDDALRDGNIQSFAAFEKARLHVSSVHKSKKQKKDSGSSLNRDSELDSLAAMIRGRQDRPSSAASAMSSIFEKYGNEDPKAKGKGKGRSKDVTAEPDISDAEFERIQRSLDKTKKK